MWALLRNAATVGFLYRFLRPRWKRLGISLGVIVVAFYAHGEYLDYLDALPVAEVPRESVAWAFVLKNAVVAVSLIAAVLPELRRARPSRRIPSGKGDRAQPETADDRADAQCDRARAEADAPDPFRNIGNVTRKPVIRTRAEEILNRKQ